MVPIEGNLCIGRDEVVEGSVEIITGGLHQSVDVSLSPIGKFDGNVGHCCMKEVDGCLFECDLVV